MAIDPRLLEILVCTACRGDLAGIDGGDGLRCTACGRVYPVRDGIPIMLIDEPGSPADPA